MGWCFLLKIILQHKQLNNQPELKPETLQSFCITYEDNFRSVSGFYYCWLLCNCRLYAFWICCCSIFQFYQTHLVLNEIQWILCNTENYIEKEVVQVSESECLLLKRNLYYTTVYFWYFRIFTPSQITQQWTRIEPWNFANIFFVWQRRISPSDMFRFWLVVERL